MCSISDGKRIEETLQANYHISLIMLVILLISMSAYDLFSPPIASKTIFRQTHTAMLTDNFVKEGFSLNGLYLNIFGNEKLLMIYEFPAYNFVVGILYSIFRSDPFWGKVVSIISALLAMILFVEITRRRYGYSVGLISGLFFILSPIGLMMYSSFQPDTFSMLFVILSLWFLYKWHETKTTVNFTYFSVALLIAGLVKYPIVVPFLPLITLAYFVDKLKFKIMDYKYFIIFIVIFIIPLVSWYVYSRAYLTDLGRSSSIIDGRFLIGDLTRFFSLSYYKKILFTIPIMSLSGVGCIYFILGLKKIDVTQGALLAGIPFYFIFIPTVRDQWYYLLPCAPIFALFMAKGINLMMRWPSSWGKNIALSTSTALFLIGFVSCVSYELKRDYVSWESAKSLRQISNSDDLAFFINTHDRGAGIGGQNPTLSYLSQRKGWNVQYGSFDWFKLEYILNQIKQCKNKGAKWVVITFYSEDLEPWVVRKFVPKQFHPDPKALYIGLDSDAIISTLEHRKDAIIEVKNKNFVVMKLNN